MDSMWLICPSYQIYLLHLLFIIRVITNRDRRFYHFLIHCFCFGFLFFLFFLSHCVNFLLGFVLLSSDCYFCNWFCESVGCWWQHYWKRLLPLLRLQLELSWFVGDLREGEALKVLMILKALLQKKVILAVLVIYYFVLPHVVCIVVWCFTSYHEKYSWQNTWFSFALCFFVFFCCCGCLLISKDLFFFFLPLFFFLVTYSPDSKLLFIFI